MSEKQHISLYQLQSIIKHRLEKEMPLSCWVTAEISEMKVNYSGHCYLELVEKGGQNQVPKAKVSAIIWRSAFGAIDSYFRSATGNQLAEGMNVLLSVRVNYHEIYGLSLIVSDIDPLYTLGDMERQRQETIAKLKEEGVFDMNKMVELPSVIQRIAIISSRNAAGYQDFVNQISASPFNFELTLFDSFMQGAAAEESVVSALEQIVNSMELFDVVVVIRGGGSQSDLAAFDSYRLTSHLAQFPLPVITGIGHDKDQSVADLVASVALKTPTATAVWLIERLEEFDEWLSQMQEEVVSHATSVLDGERQKMRNISFALSKTASGLTRSLEVRLERLSAELIARHGRAIMQRLNRLERLQETLAVGATRRLSREQSRLELATQMTKSRAPERILSLGFAIVSSGGKALRSADGVEIGDKVDVRLYRDTLKATVTDKEKLK